MHSREEIWHDVRLERHDDLVGKTDSGDEVEKDNWRDQGEEQTDERTHPHADAARGEGDAARCRVARLRSRLHAKADAAADYHEGDEDDASYDSFVRGALKAVYAVGVPVVVGARADHVLCVCRGRTVVSSAHMRIWFCSARATDFSVGKAGLGQ